MLMVALCRGTTATTTLFSLFGNGANNFAAFPSVTPSSFSESLAIDPNGTQATLTVAIANVTDYQQAHLHLGGPTEEGPIVVWVDPIFAGLLPSPPQFKTVDGVLTFSTTFDVNSQLGPFLGKTNFVDLVAALQAGNIYADVHTKENPFGLLRQQLTPASSTFSAPMLLGSNENPPHNSSATGSSTLTFAPDLLTANVTVSLANITNYFVTHIHAGNQTTNGPIVLFIMPTAASFVTAPPQFFDIGSAVITLTFNATSLVGPLANSTDLAGLRDLAANDGIYVNAHTKAFPAGEIRSQYRYSPVGLLTA